MHEGYKKHLFKSGLRLVTYHIPEAQSVALGIWIRVGGRYESRTYKGIAHFLEHLAFKGTKRFSLGAIKREIEGRGGSLNGFTSEEYTCYFAKVLSKNLSITLEILKDMVLNPLIPPLEMERERTVILEEIKMYRDLPQAYVYELLDGLLWPNHPLGMNLTGTLDSIKKIKREDILRFKERYYCFSNMAIAVCGAFEEKELFKRLNDYSTESKKIFSFLPAKKLKNGPRVKFYFKETEQTHLAMGFPALRRDHPRHHTLSLLHVILGANMSSRLFQEIREKRGLAYEIGTQLKRLQDTGAFIIHAGIDNSKVLKALKVIIKELQRLTFQQVGIREFRRIKDFYLGQIILNLEDNLNRMLWAGEQTICLDKIETVPQIKNKVNKITREDLKNLARYIFDKKLLHLALISPLKDKDKRKILNLLQ